MDENYEPVFLKELPSLPDQSKISFTGLILDLEVSNMNEHDPEKDVPHKVVTIQDGTGEAEVFLDIYKFCQDELRPFRALSGIGHLRKRMLPSGLICRIHVVRYRLISDCNEELLEYMSIQKYKLQRQLQAVNENRSKVEGIFSSKNEEKVQAIREAELLQWKSQHLPHQNSEETINWRKYKEIIAGEIMRVLQTFVIMRYAQALEAAEAAAAAATGTMVIEGNASEESRLAHALSTMVVTVTIDEIANDESLFDVIGIYFKVDSKQAYLAKIVQVLEDFQATKIVVIQKVNEKIIYAIRPMIFERILQAAEKIIHNRKQVGCTKNLLRDNLVKQFGFPNIAYSFISDSYTNYLTTVLSDQAKISMRDDAYMIHCEF